MPQSVIYSDSAASSTQPHEECARQRRLSNDFVKRKRSSHAPGCSQPNHTYAQAHTHTNTNTIHQKRPGKNWSSSYTTISVQKSSKPYPLHAGRLPVVPRNYVLIISVGPRHRCIAMFIMQVPKKAQEKPPTLRGAQINRSFGQRPDRTGRLEIAYPNYGTRQFGIWRYRGIDHQTNVQQCCLSQ